MFISLNDESDYFPDVVVFSNKLFSISIGSWQIRDASHLNSFYELSRPEPTGTIKQI